MRFANAVAEEEGHPPDFCLHDNRELEVSTSTHAIGGLSENEFILAGPIDARGRDRAPRARQGI